MDQSRRRNAHAIRRPRRRRRRRRRCRRLLDSWQLDEFISLCPRWYVSTGWDVASARPPKEDTINSISASRRLTTSPGPLSPDVLSLSLRRDLR